MAESARAAGYVIWVDFEVHPAHMARFEMLLRANAQASLASEPGCRRFDVLAPLAAANAVSLYEIYDDAAAFEAHLASDHYCAFAAQTVEAVLSKHARVFSLQPA